MAESVPATDAAPSAGASAADQSRQVLGRGSIYTLASAAPILSALVVLPVVTRVLSQSEYGVVALSLTVIQISTVLAGCGLALSITRHSLLEASGLDGARGLVAQSWFVAPAALAVAAAVGLPLLQVSGIDLGPGPLACAAVAAVAAGIIANSQGFLRAVNRPWPYVAFAALMSLGGPIAGVTGVLALRRSGTVYLVGLAGTYLLAAVVATLLTLRSGPSERSRETLTKALRIGLPTIPHQLALSLAQGAMIMLTAAQLGHEQSGRVQVAFYLGNVPAVLVSAINNAWVPLVMRTTEQERPAILDRTSRDVIWLAVGGAVGIGLLAPYFLTYLASAKYEPTRLAPLSTVVALTGVMALIYLSSSHQLFITGKTLMLAVITPASVVLGSLVGYLVMREHGLIGAATGFLASYVFLALNVSLYSWFRVGRVWWPRVLLLPAALGTTAALLVTLLPIGGWGLAVRLVLAVVVAAACVRHLIRTLRASGR